MKILSYLLGLGAVASLITLNLSPASAQVGNGSDNVTHSPLLLMLVVVELLVAVDLVMQLRVKLLSTKFHNL